MSAGLLGWEVDDLDLAAAAWSRLAEPGDPVAGWLTAELGTADALRWVERAQRDLDAAVDRLPGWRSLAPGPRRSLRLAARRLGGRLDGLDPRRDLRVLRSLGGRLARPGQADWPGGLDDLGVRAPHCLWVRGDLSLAGATRSAVAVVGARAATAYGEHVAVGLAAELATPPDAGARGAAVVSGGAYGIDAAAHRGALAAGGATIAVLAGGVDRFYPAGNAGLLTEVAASGLVLSEVPPGSAPTRSRFLERNRLIAALSGVCVVVEAAWRSGALSTAHHAAALLRPVGAVPGPVTSMASAGCHRLLREGLAVCVTDAAEVRELLGPLVLECGGEEPAPPDPWSALERKVLDAVPVRRGATVDSIARAAGLTAEEVGGRLGRLVLAGLVEGHGAGWRLRRSVADG